MYYSKYTYGSIYFLKIILFFGVYEIIEVSTVIYFFETISYPRQGTFIFKTVLVSRPTARVRYIKKILSANS